MSRVIFRTEASSLIGIVHLKRCLNLARALTELGEFCVFAVNKETITIYPELQIEFQTEIFPSCYEEIAETREFVNNLDLIVVDSPDLGIAWEKKLTINKLIAIDDLNRAHQVDLLIDQNFRLQYDSCYPNTNARKLLGPKYGLLDSSFRIAREKSLPLLAREKKLLIAYEETTPRDIVVSTCLSLRRPFNEAWSSELITGASLETDALITSLKSKVLLITGQLPNLSNILSESQLVLGAGAAMHWESFCLGVPCLTLTVSEAQSEINNDLASAGYIELLGEMKSFDFYTLSIRIAELAMNDQKRLEISKKCLDLVDGLGAERVAREISIL